MGIAYVYIRWWWRIKVQVKSSVRGTWSRRPAPPTFRTTGRPVPPAPPRTEENGMEEVDRILDKILAKGIDSLTEVEREIMRKYSDRMKH